MGKECKSVCVGGSSWVHAVSLLARRWGEILGDAHWSEEKFQFSTN